MSSAGDPQRGIAVGRSSAAHDALEFESGAADLVLRKLEVVARELLKEKRVRCLVAVLDGSDHERESVGGRDDWQ